MWIVGLAGQASSSPPSRPLEDQKPIKAKVASVVDADNRFAIDLYQRVRGEDGNLFFSPASISMALAMTYVGAAGDTEAEMAKTLHFDIPKAQLAEEMRALRTSWNAESKNQGFRLNVANRLWGQDGYRFLPDFLRITRTDYGAELGRVDFRGEPEQARQAINAWVEDNTARKITNLIPSSAALRDARLVLTNAVYFKGEWQAPFSKSLTKDADFQISVDRKTKAPLMHKQAHFWYAAVDGLQLLYLPYGDRSLSMVVLLPEAADGLSRLEEKLTNINLQKWVATLVSQEVIVYLPKFKTTTQLQLSKTLTSTGMISAFDRATADFSGMTGDKELFISAAFHKAFVDVDEEGTEAAAATGVIPMVHAAPTGANEPPIFRADHPFVFLIRDNRTGAILFLGRIVDPTQ